MFKKLFKKSDRKSSKNTTDELLKDEPLGQKLLKKGFWLYFFTYLAAPAGYFTRVMISNSVSVADVGILYSVISFVGILSMYNGLWLTESLKYFLPKFFIKKQYTEAKSVLLRSLSVQLFTSVIIIFLLLFWANWLWVHYFESQTAVVLLKYFSIYFLANNLIQVFSSIALSFQDTFASQLIWFVNSWVTVGIVAVFFFLNQYIIVNYGLAFVVALVAGMLVAVVFYAKRYSSFFGKWKWIFDKKVMKPYIAYSLWTFLSMNAIILLGQIDQQMVIAFLGAKSAGIFANYLSLTMLSSVFVMPIMWLIFPLISELSAKNKKTEVSVLQNFLYSYIGVFIFALLAFLIALWPIIASVLYGIKFIDSGSLLYAWWIFLLFQVLLSVNFSILAGFWKAKQRVMIFLFAWPFNILMNYVFMQFWWLTWIVIATVIWYLIMFFWSCFYVKKIIPIIRDYRLWVKNFLFIMVIWMGLFFLAKDIFVYDDAYRYKNLLYIALLWIGYAGLLLWFNYKKIPFLIGEIKSLRWR